MSVYYPPREILPVFNAYDFFYFETLPITFTQADLLYALKSGDTFTGKVSFLNQALVQSNTLQPPFAMTANSQNGYTASASSVRVSFEQPFNLFSTTLLLFSTAYTSAQTYNNTGAYTGAVSTTIASPSSTYFGEWVQLQVPTAFILRRFAVVSRPAFSVRSPVDFVVLGSNNGSTWTELFRITGVPWLSTNYEPIFWSISSPTTAFSYYRLAVNRIGNGGLFLNFNGWWLFSSATENTTWMTSEPTTGFFTLPTDDIVFKSMAWNTSNISWQTLLIDATNGLGFISDPTNTYIKSSSPATQLELGANSELVIDSTGVISNLGYIASSTYSAANTVQNLAYTTSPTTVSFNTSRWICGETINTSSQPLSLDGNNLENAPIIGNDAGNFEFRMNNTGAGGSFTLTAGTDLLSGTSGGSAGQHLCITINGTPYKIKLEDP